MITIFTLTALNASISKQKEIIETLNFSRIVKAYILGVKTDTNTGIVLPLETKLEYGSGELLLDASNVSFTKDFQNTMRISLKVAQNFAGEEISKYNVIFHVSNPYNNTLTLTGSSAGTIMTVALIAALKNKTLKEGIMVTGGINENGEILMSESKIQDENIIEKLVMVSRNIVKSIYESLNKFQEVEGNVKYVTVNLQSGFSILYVIHTSINLLLIAKTEKIGAFDEIKDLIKKVQEIFEAGLEQETQTT